MTGILNLECESPVRTTEGRAAEGKSGLNTIEQQCPDRAQSRANVAGPTGGS